MCVYHNEYPLVDPRGLPYLFTRVALVADYVLQVGDIPRQQALLNAPTSRTVPHLTSIAKATSTSPTNVSFVSGYRYIEALSLLYPIKRIVNNVTA